MRKPEQLCAFSVPPSLPKMGQ